MRVATDFDLRAALSEFISSTGFLYFSIGTAVLSNDAFMTALVFGLAVAVFIYVSQHSRAGQLNPVVSVALAVTGYITPIQAVLHVFAQLAGGVFACALLLLTVQDEDMMNLAANKINDGFTVGNAFVGEAVSAFVLQLVVFETMLHPHNKAGKMGPLAVGFIVFVVHGVLRPIDNCSLNPARSFGPAIVKNTWDNFWVFILGPLCGALLAVPCHILFLSEWGRLPRKTHSGSRGTINV